MSISITTKDLVKRYRQRTVVNHVSIDVKQGEIVGLLGPNGAGKTTTFYQVVGLIKPDEGSVFLNDTNITNLPMYKRAKLGIGYLPQEASVFRKLTVEDNIMAVLQMTKMNRDERREKLETLIREFRLEHVRKSNGDVVSGGERRRTEIARALATDPKFILLDEPFAGIDPIAVEDIQAIVARLKYKNIGILITDHNVTETLSICDRAYLLIEGKIFKHGTAEELAADDEVKRLYLGRNFELRRKDYLHEEARGLITPVEITETNPSRLIQFTEHTIEKTKSILDFIDDLGQGNNIGKMAEDMHAGEYMKELRELKASLIGFATNIEHEELVQRALEIPDLDFKEYEKIFSFRDFTSVANSQTGNSLVDKAASVIYFEKLDLLKKQLIEVDSILGICAIYLKAIL
ncbi:MAG TPA: LPS export ABC transporter ATP-binding protein [Chitinophagaceae bacterium]|jgi:lipopolysaccharide export system ATP-binding protein|nr:LPS export ABC transporter ATP-binding protein [Chitinophagaceae bacterium]